MGAKFVQFSESVQRKSNARTERAYNASHDMICHNAIRTTRRLHQSRVSKPKLFNQGRLITQQLGNEPCAHNGSDWVRRISHYKDLATKLLVTERGQSFD